eukprot:TRINITY_DN3700_c0_g1_i13.p1 TRINITY_DN3700_c0_g1~~TRINITY_DN3700_c0_g1_i13.p1  ORF type:complete len:291 (+),score=7.68 TRINITY_DN3700_c0_g1_i13:38-874(+)
MTLTCSLISENNLCEVPAVTDGDYCQRSCGTCVKCFTSNLGCQCLSKWEYKDKMYSGCENPDQDDKGSWCEIDKDSCTGYKFKSYHYCAEDCTVQDLRNTAQQPSRVSLTSEQDASPPPPSENESVREGIQIGAVTSNQIILVNQGSTVINLTGWYLETEWEVLEFREKGDKVCTKSFLEPKDKIVIQIAPASSLNFFMQFSSVQNQNLQEDNNLKNDCNLSSQYQFFQLRLFDVYTQLVSQIDLLQYPLSSLNELTSYCLQDGGYVKITKLQCEYFS